MTLRTALGLLSAILVLVGCTSDEPIPLPRDPGLPLGHPAHFYPTEPGEYRETVSSGFSRGWFAADFACDSPWPLLCYDSICSTGTDWGVALPPATWGIPIWMPRLGNCRRWIEIPSGAWSYLSIELPQNDRSFKGTYLAAHPIWEKVSPFVPPLMFEYCYGGICEQWDHTIGFEVRCYDGLGAELLYDDCYDQIPRTLWRLTVPLPAGQEGSEDVWIQGGW
jgi:hypothetical protein